MKYTNEDKICPHCGGKLQWHSLGEDGIIKWCDNCGSNDSEKPPKIEITVSP